MQTILTINSGSSSLKLGLYSSESGAAPRVLYKGAADAIGKSGGSLIISDAQGHTVHREDAAHESQSDALTHASARLRELTSTPPSGIGFRIVHGGPNLREHCAITPQVRETLRAATHYAPLHIPPALALLDTAGQIYPGVPAFACFDTAFHTTLPPEARTYPIPARYRTQGIERYGFHGLSYESIVAALAPNVPPRLVVAHLGNGASLCAIAHGRSVDTSMGLTPTGGIPMGTRTGDLDPGVVLYLARQGGDRNTPLNADQLESVLNHQSGLIGLSGTAGHSDTFDRAGTPDRPGTADMRELTKRSDDGDRDAALAISIFCRAIAKTVASYAAVLGGLDCLVFTGGIGEHSAAVRQRVCEQLAFLGIALDPASNQQHARAVSKHSSQTQIVVLPAAEDDQIARHVQQLMI
jgi:acetate kinase